MRKIAKNVQESEKKGQKRLRILDNFLPPCANCSNRTVRAVFSFEFLVHKEVRVKVA